MKQKKFWSKLLSLGLAAAMTIASLTGPGSVTNPVEVKAEEEKGKIDGMSMTFGDKTVSDSTYTVVHDGKEHKPASVTVTVTPAGVVTGGGVEDNPTSPSAINVSARESKQVVIPAAEFATGKEGIKVEFLRGTEAATNFTDVGIITVKVTADGVNYTGGTQLTYEITEESGAVTPELKGTVTLSGTMKVGQTITATVTDAPKDAKLKYAFRRVKGEKSDLIIESNKNTYVLVAADAGAKIEVVVTADDYTGEITATSDVVAAADSSSGGNTSTGGSTGGSSTSTPSTTPSTGNTTTTTETKPDGTKVETKTETKADGTKVETVTETKKDGSATTTVKETEKNASGKEVAVTTVTEKDASGKVQSETTTSVIAKADTNTSATVTTVKDSKGAVTATAEVKKTGTTDETGKTKGTISATVIKQITEAAGTANVEISQTVTNGDKKFTVKANAKDLVSGSKMKIMKLDPKTGEYVLCNKKSYAVNAAGDVDLSIKTDGDFILVNEADAKAASDAVLKTVKVKSSSKTVTKGKSTTVAMSSGLNMKNVSKITYTVSNKSVATVSKNGKVTTKKAGTVTVKAKVTLKNGKTKTVTMKIKVK